MVEFSNLWAIKPTVLRQLVDSYGDAMREGRLLAAHSVKPSSHDRPGYETRDGVALIHLTGVLTKRESLWSSWIDMTSTAQVSNALRQALADSAVRAIVLVIDSPGGTVDGTQELARQISASRRGPAGKPIVAYSDGMMASAAYWIGAAADQVFISGDTTELGSIGVVATHVDISKAEDARGIKTTEIVAGQYKRVASIYKPLSDLGRATIQEQVDHIYSVFVQDVATFRNTTPETVRRTMADGRIFLGQRAIDAGLADGRTTLDALMAHLRTSTASIGARAMSLLTRFKGDATVQRQYRSVSAFAEATDPDVLRGYDRRVPVR